MLIVKHTAKVARNGISATRGRGRVFLRLDRLAWPPQSAGFSTEPEKLTLSYTKGAERPILHHTYGQVIEDCAEKFADRVYVTSVEQGVQFSSAELLQKADRLAAGLLSLGLEKGDRVALWGPNCWEWILANFALARAGLIMVAMNPLIMGDDVVHNLSLTKVAAVIAPEEHQGRRYHDMLVSFAPELLDAKPGTAKCAKFPYLRAAICLKGKTPAHAVSADKLQALASESDVAAIKKLQNDINPDGTVLHQFSSGTTGKPKAVAVSHKGFTNNGRFFAEGLPSHLFNQPVVHCVQVPFFHTYGFTAGICAALQVGATLVIPAASYNPKANLRSIITEKCTFVSGTPTMYLDLVRQTETDGRPEHSVNVAAVGGAPMLPQLARDIIEILKVKNVHDVYGLSEATAACFQSTENDTLEQRCYTVGKPCFNVEAKVVDLQGNTVPVNTSGELWLRGYLRMIEYFDQPEVTAKCITEDDWIKTGDQFLLDEHGYGKVIGRFKDMIIRGGENISPTETEDVLVTHPAIIDVQVVGVEDDRLGEEVCACLTVRNPVTPQEIREFCKGKISTYKMPRYLYVLKDGEAFPRTASGKVQKHILRDTCNALLKEEKLLDSQKKMDNDTNK